MAKDRDALKKAKKKLKKQTEDAIQEEQEKYVYQLAKGEEWYCTKCEMDYKTRKEAMNCCIEIKKRDARAQYYPITAGNKDVQLKIRLENDHFIYCLIKNNKEGLETKVSIDFYQNEEKRHKFFKNVIKSLGVKNRKNEEKIHQSLEEILVKIQKNNFFKSQIADGNGKQWKQRKRKETQTNIIHGAGGVYDNLIIEPLGNYRYLYNYKGKRGISLVSFKPDNQEPFIEIKGEEFYFSSEPLNDVVFRIPTKSSIDSFINGTYKVKKPEELFTGVVNYLKILYDLPKASKYYVTAIGLLQSWIIDTLNVVMYLSFSARFGAGKTAFLEGLAIVARHGFLAGDINPAGVARITNKYQLSLFGDELDVKAQGKDNETFLVFRQGYKRDNPYVRMKETSKGYKEEIIDVFGFKGYSVHSKSEDALATRSMDTALRISTDKTLPILNMYKEEIGFPLFEEFFFWYMSNATEVMETWKRDFQKWKRTSTGEKNSSVSKFPSFPRFNDLDTDEIKKIREKLFSEYTKNFSKEEIKVLRKFFGRDEELFFVTLQVCKIFKIDKISKIEEVFIEKVENRGNDNLFIQILKELLIEIYEGNKDDINFYLKGGDFESCFYFEKSGIYKKYREKLKENDFRHVGNSRFREYLMELDFNDGVNIRKEKIRTVEGKTKAVMCLIYDDPVIETLELEKNKDMKFVKQGKIVINQDETALSEQTNQNIDLSKYKMTIRQIEEILGSEKLPALQIARRMNKTNINEMDSIEGILKQAVADSSFETTLKVDPEGNYFNKNMERSNDK